MHKISFPCYVFLFIELFFLCNSVLANNASYITLSNQIARKRQLEVVANNAANTSTPGYKQDDILLRKVDIKQNSKRANSFVWAETTYKNGEEGGLKITNRPTDLAINGVGYFKIITPRGPRYTLDGSMIVNRENQFVNIDGYPYLSIDGQIIEVPDNFQRIDITEDGTIFVDEEEIGVIGVFKVIGDDSIINEGSRLYKTSGADVVSEEYKIVSGAIRQSNVNPTLVMAKMVEMQRSVGLTNSLMSDVAEIEKITINKIGK